MPSALAELVALIAPPTCLGCGAACDPARVLCGRCVSGLPWLVGCCPACALPAHGPAPCPARGRPVARAWSPVAYDGPAQALVRAVKRRGSRAAAELMAAQLAVNLPADLRDAPAVVPVPAHPWRRRRRGFDPAELLAAGLARRLGVPLAPALRRSDLAPRQARADRERRRAGRMRVDVVIPVAPGALLVDDVHTTGATLAACADALVAAGSPPVALVAYARTLERA